MLQPTQDIFFLLHNYAIMTLYILERTSSRFTPRIRPSRQARVRLRFLLLSSISILLVCFGPPSILLFTATTHFSRSNPPLPAGQLNINVQVNYMATLHNIYTVTYISTSHLYYYSLPSSYFFHSFGQAGWLRPFLSVTGLIYLYYKKIRQILVLKNC
jgi:hypothetical protein